VLAHCEPPAPLGEWGAEVVVLIPVKWCPNLNFCACGFGHHRHRSLSSSYYNCPHNQECKLRVHRVWVMDPRVSLKGRTNPGIVLLGF